MRIDHHKATLNRNERGLSHLQEDSIGAVAKALIIDDDAEHEQGSDTGDLGLSSEIKPKAVFSVVIETKQVDQGICGGDYRELLLVDSSTVENEEVAKIWGVTEIQSPKNNNTDGIGKQDGRKQAAQLEGTETSLESDDSPSLSNGAATGIEKNIVEFQDHSHDSVEGKREDRDEEVTNGVNSGHEYNDDNDEHGNKNHDPAGESRVDFTTEMI